MGTWRSRLRSWAVVWVFAASPWWVAAAPAQEKQQPCPVSEAKPDAAIRFVRRQIVADLQAGKKDDALELVKTWIAKRPFDPVLQESFGEVLYSRNAIPDSTAAINEAMQLDPCNPQAHYFAWRLNVLAGLREAGWQQLQMAHELALANASIERTWTRVKLAREMQTSPGAPQIQRFNPLREDFFAQGLDCEGIPILASAAVDGDALQLACGKIETMLAHLDKVRKTMSKRGAEFHIIGEREGTSALPENQRYQTEAYVDAQGQATSMDTRTRGVGGLKSSCGEENLLGLPTDRYFDGPDLCTHEFAHDVMDNGFDGKMRKEIEAQYKSSTAQGLWKGVYAAVSPKEYWAELSMWYFGSHGTFASNGVPAIGSAGLRSYDPGGFALLDRLYGNAK